MKLSTSLLFISWIPLIQFTLLRLYREPHWLFFISIVLSLIGEWLLIKSIPKDSMLHRSAIRLIKFVFFSILLFAVPVFFCICKFFEIKIQGFNYNHYSEYSPFPLIISIISAGLLCFVLFLVWKEAQEEDKPYNPVLKFILASIFLLWQLNIGFHFFYDFFYTHPHMYVQSHYYPQRDNIYPSLESYHTLKVLVFSFYIILNLLFFGAIFLKGKFRERLNLLFSYTGCLMVIGVFTLNYGLINGTRLSTNYYVFNFAIVFTMSFITIMKSILITAVVFTLIGGMLSFSWKGFGNRRVSVPGVICKKGVALVLVTMVLYVFLFGYPWPFQDPAVNIHMRVIINSFERTSKAELTNGHFDYVFYFGFLSHGKCAVMPLINQLEDNSPIKRAVAADFLCYLGDERAVEPLLETLNDKDGVVILQAARALAELKEPRVIDILLNKLDHEDKEIRTEVIRSFTFFKDVRIVDKLIEQLKTEKAGEVIWEINFSLYLITEHGASNPEENEKTAEWWQQWWKQHREEFIKKW